MDAPRAEPARVAARRIPAAAGLAAVNPANNQSWNRYAYVLDCFLGDVNSSLAESACIAKGGTWANSNTTIKPSATPPGEGGVMRNA